MKKDYGWGSSSSVTWSYTENNKEKLFEKKIVIVVWLVKQIL